MALSNNGEMEVRKTGDDRNAGYFNKYISAVGIDYSQQDNPQFEIDGVNIIGTVASDTWRINVSGLVVSSGLIGNGLHIYGGVATSGLYQINAVEISFNRIVLDRGAGAHGNNVVGRIGGALASPGKAMQLISSLTYGTIIHVKHGNYFITNTSVTSDGLVNRNMEGTVILIGYENQRSDNGKKPSFIASGVTGVLVYGANYGAVSLYNICIDGNNADVAGVSSNDVENIAHIVNCHIKNCPKGVTSTCNLVGCKVENCVTGVQLSTNPYYQSPIVMSEFNNCQIGVDYLLSSSHNVPVVIFCRAYNCGIGFRSGSIYNRSSFINLSAISCGTGYCINRGVGMINCIATNCNVGLIDLTAPNRRHIRMSNCAFYNNIINISGHAQNRLVYNPIDLQNDPWVDLDNKDFRLNNLPDGGILLKNAGLGLPGHNTFDIGPVPKTIAPIYRNWGGGFE